MTLLPFQQVDVFTTVPFRGNPVAVILDARDLTGAEMQAIASWTNLSETTFVCPPRAAAADYRLRIFTPRRELPFAGHPTIGSAHALLRHGLTPRQPGRLVQECGKGLVDLSVEGERIALALPVPAFRDPGPEALGQAAAALGLPAADVARGSMVDVGPVWLTVEIRDGAQVAKLEPDMAAIAALTREAATGITVFGFQGEGGPADVEVRSFAPAQGIPEDPVCGSGNGCVAALIQRDRLLAKGAYAASQGRCLGRDGRVEVRFAGDGTIWLGGPSVTCVEGTLRV